MSDMFVVEMQAEGGFRYWSKPMPASEVDAYIAKMESYGDTFSDCDTYTVPARYVCPNSLMEAE